ncbi:hypothetical protein, partial [Arsenophonus sp.]|uniref:hypothetical protein n=1 Tax=Arsenophonus sp. TaxID=1872640 RepID=UPI00387942BE
QQKFMHFWLEVFAKIIHQAIKFSKIVHNCLTMLYSLTRLLEYLNKTGSFNYLNIKTFSLFLIPNSGYYKRR